MTNAGFFRDFCDFWRKSHDRVKMAYFLSPQPTQFVIITFEMITLFMLASTKRPKFANDKNTILFPNASRDFFRMHREIFLSIDANFYSMCQANVCRTTRDCVAVCISCVGGVCLVCVGWRASRARVVRHTFSCIWGVIFSSFFRHFFVFFGKKSTFLAPPVDQIPFKNGVKIDIFYPSRGPKSL